MITRLSKLRYLRIAGLALGSVAVAGAAVLVTASASGLNFGFKPASTTQTLAATSPSTGPSTKASDVCSTFMTHLSTDLGKSQADLNAAIEKAIGQTLTDEVNNGTITQAQANAIKQRLGNQQVCALAGQLGKGNHHAKGQIGAYLQQYQSAAASALGITDAELKTDLANGQTLSQIAAAKSVTEADFRTRLIAKLQPTLDAAVANKQLTAAQEQIIINRLKTGPLPLWDKPLHSGAPATATPAANT